MKFILIFLLSIFILFSCRNYNYETKATVTNVESIISGSSKTGSPIYTHRVTLSYKVNSLNHHVSIFNNKLQMGQSVNIKVDSEDPEHFIFN